MAWSWSHTSEAYAAAERNLRRLDRDTLLDIAAEWRAVDPGADDADPEGFSPARYEGARATLVRDRVESEYLADDIWERACDLATCDNGGWHAWMCPYGCGAHTVPFDDSEADS